MEDARRRRVPGEPRAGIRFWAGPEPGFPIAGQSVDNSVAPPSPSPVAPEPWVRGLRRRPLTGRDVARKGFCGGLAAGSIPGGRTRKVSRPAGWDRRARPRALEHVPATNPLRGPTPWPAGRLPSENKQGGWWPRPVESWSRAALRHGLPRGTGRRGLGEAGQASGRDQAEPGVLGGGGVRSRTMVCRIRAYVHFRMSLRILPSKGEACAGTPVPDFLTNEAG